VVQKFFTGRPEIFGEMLLERVMETIAAPAPAAAAP